MYDQVMADALRDLAAAEKEAARLEQERDAALLEVERLTRSCCTLQEALTASREQRDEALAAIVRALCDGWNDPVDGCDAPDVTARIREILGPVAAQ